MAASNWAVILCKFADDSSATPLLEQYQKLFTSAGAGTLNMVDFFLDMSHGNVDIGGSQIFTGKDGGWITLPFGQAAYAGNVTTPPPGKVNRNGLVAACRKAATDGGIDLSQFAGLVVSMDGVVDLFGYVGGMAMFCDASSLTPAPLGQEMGHGYGLDHARRDGSEQDYQDPTDVMSVFNADSAPTTDWPLIGPGLNAWCMRSRGWLDESRVWVADNNAAFETVVQLRPLHWRDLPGLLAIQLGEYLVEFRVKERWDLGLPGPCVLVHRFDNNHSYIMADTTGSIQMGVGSIFQRGNPNSFISGYLGVEVQSIDAANKVATVKVRHRPFFRVPPLVGVLFGGVARDGGGGILVGGKFHPVPPREPEIALLRQLAAFLAAGEIDNVVVRAQVQREALAEMSRIIAAADEQLQPLRSPSPPRTDSREP
jgi:hypothetical protein